MFYGWRYQLGPVLHLKVQLISNKVFKDEAMLSIALRHDITMLFILLIGDCIGLYMVSTID